MMAKQLNYYGMRDTLDKWKQTSKKPMPSPSKEPSRSTDEDSDDEPKITKTVTQLDILAQELSSDTSDEDYEPQRVVSVVPGSPQHGKCSLITIFPDDREDEPVQGEIHSHVHQDGDVEDQGQDEGGDKEEEADGNGGMAVEEKDADNDGEEEGEEKMIAWQISPGASGLSHY